MPGSEGGFKGGFNRGFEGDEAGLAESVGPVCPGNSSVLLRGGQGAVDGSGLGKSRLHLGDPQNGWHLLLSLSRPV